MKKILIPLIFLLVITGCSLPKSNPGTALPIVQTIIPTAAPVNPTATPSQLPVLTATPAITATPTAKPFSPFDAVTMADYINLRANPGKLFNVILNLPQGTSFRVLAKSPGGEWIYGEGPSNTKGWIFADLLQASENLKNAPVMQPEKALLVKGKVVNEKGFPISGIQFALTQNSNQGMMRNDAMTDANGEFFAFMPLTTQGDWGVVYVAIACTSNIMDPNCLCKPGACGKPFPLETMIIIPQATPLEFTWK